MTVSIDCGDCAMAKTNACDDCVVSFIVNRQPGDAVVVDADAARALRLLGGAGLVPESRHRPRTKAGSIPKRLSVVSDTQSLVVAAIEPCLGRYRDERDRPLRLRSP